MSAPNAEAAIAPPPPLRRPWTNARIAGHVCLTIWAVIGLYVLYYLIVNLEKPFFEFALPHLSGDWAAYATERIESHQFDSFLERYGLKYWSGVLVTLQIVALSLLYGALLSVPVALARASRWKIFSWPAYAYVYFFRGTPLLAQTYLVYYGLGSFSSELKELGLWWFFRDAFYCIVFAFSLNTSAYQAEILRGAIQNVAKGQWEGAAALGLSRPVILFKVILPQAMIVALRPYINETILMIKGSAIAAIVTVFDLFCETRRAFSRSLDFQAYIWAAILYLLIVETLRRICERIERRLTRHLQR